MNYYLTLYLIYAALSIKCEKRTGAPEKNKAEDPCGIRLCLGIFTVLLFWKKLDIKIIIKIIKIFPRDALFCFAEFIILRETRKKPEGTGFSLFFDGGFDG